MNQDRIILWLKEKDKRAIAYLYDNYSAALYGMVLRIVHKEAIAQDVLQDVFVKIWKNGDKYDIQKGTLFTWMVSIARNTALNHIQSKAFRNNEKNQPLDNMVHPTDNKTLIQQINVNKIGLEGLVSRLDEKYKTIIDLVYFQGFTQREVHEHLGIPLGTVKSRVKIALRELRRVFDHELIIVLILSSFI